MKRLIIVVAVLSLFSISAFAQMGSGMMGEQKGEMKPQGMMPPMMGEGQRMPMMNQEMMQMMMGMMDMQEKMMMGMKPEEKKKMMADMAQMKAKMQMMMSMHMGSAPGMSDPRNRFRCAETWLKKAIDLHELHIKDPKTATEASQTEMMDQLKKAYECVKGTDARGGDAPAREPAGRGPTNMPPSKADPHKH